MTYERNPTWVDGPDGLTPITAEKLNNIESGIGYAGPVPALAGTAASGTFRNGADNYFIPDSNTTVAYGTPHPTAPGVTVAAVGLYCSTAGSGETFKVGIYDSDPGTGAPTDLLVAQTTIDVATTGIKQITVNVAPSGGFIWVFVASTTAAHAARLRGYFENTTMAFVPARSSGILAPGMLRIDLSAGNMPDPAGTVTVVNNDGRMPAFAVLY